MATELPETVMVALCEAIGKSMAAELPEAGSVAICVAIGNAMAAGLPEVGMVALCIAIAVGCRVILKPVMGAPARGPGLDHSVLLFGFTVVVAYLAGVILINFHLTPAAGTPVAFRQYLLFLCALLVLLFLAFLFLAAGGWYGVSGNRGSN